MNKDLKKALSIIKRLIKSNAREGWEDTEHYNEVLKDALDFVSNFEIMEDVEKAIEEEHY